MLTLLFGGLLAAPIAPHLVTRLQPQLLGVIVGGFLCITNARVLLKASGHNPMPVLAVLAIAWIGASFRVATRDTKLWDRLGTLLREIDQQIDSLRSDNVAGFDVIMATSSMKQ